MKKIYVLALICIPLCLILGLQTSKATGVSGQEKQDPVPGYHRESVAFSMAEAGKLLERLGKEIQQNKSITIGGNSYSFGGQGVFEISIGQRGAGRTSMQLEMLSDMKAVPKRGRTYVSYARSGGRPSANPANLADIVADIGKNLASTGAFVMEYHKVAIEGSNIMIKQRVTESVSVQARGQQMPYTYSFDVIFGVPRFPVPADEVDDQEAEQRGWIKELAVKEISMPDQKEIAKLFESLSSDLKAGKVKVGDKAFDVGKGIQYGISHLATTDDKAHRVRIGIQFGEMPPRPKRGGPRYSKEFFDEPISKVGKLLKRLGIEILDTGAFKFGENEFNVKEKLANYEVIASSSGFSIELSYTKPKKEK